MALNWFVSDFKWIDGYKYNLAWPNVLETKSMKTIVEYMTYLYEISGSTIHMEVSYLTYNTRTYLWKKSKFSLGSQDENSRPLLARITVWSLISMVGEQFSQNQ